MIRQFGDEIANVTRLKSKQVVVVVKTGMEEVGPEKSWKENEEKANEPSNEDLFFSRIENFNMMDAEEYRYSKKSSLSREIVQLIIAWEYDFFQNLEMHVRANFPPLCGRDHLAFRSYYHPCKNVIDGDLCEQFGLMDTAAQREVIEGLDRTTSEISKKLEDIRTRYAF
ncbi:hypothetical protein Q1695_009967 [Nippostrongylus brasiliensis]|nr:hypothetical protein Q1695_009967 [Nippostrongylus brasiliensis]